MTKLTFPGMVRGQLRTQAPVATADLTGKTVIVLGANTGLGYEAAVHFARMNPGRLILACRSQERGQAALDKLQTATKFKKAELWIIDLADFASVKCFADKFEKDGGRLDILVENAGVAYQKYTATKDGWETSIQVNNISTPLLALLLLPRMLQTAKEHFTLPRLVVVASETHHMAVITKDVLQSETPISKLGSAEYCTSKVMPDRYPLTKLLNVLFVRALNERLGASVPLIVNVVNPGLCSSELMRNASAATIVIGTIMHKTIAFTPEVGSRRLVWGAVGSPENPDALRGEYINQCATEEPSDFVISAEGKKFQDRLWKELLPILGKIDLRATATVEKYLS